MEAKYTYENVKKAYEAIIEVGKHNTLLGQVGAQCMHVMNLKQLEGATLELYEKLINDESIKY